MNAGALDRFLAKVEPEPNSGCWLWSGSVTKNGYGRFGISRRDVRWAHRVAYEHWHGPIPDGLQIDHLCRVRSCVNPEHLEAVTCRTNLLRGIGFTGRQARQTHCLRGHLLEGDNLSSWHLKHKQRHCRSCDRIRQPGYDRKRRPRRRCANH